MLIEAVRARCLDITALTALVGTRVYTQILPQSPTFPAVRISEVTENEPFHLRGTSGLLRARVQVDAYAKAASGIDPYASAEAVALAAKGSFVAGEATGLSGWQGEINGVAILGIRPLDRREMYESDELRQVVVSYDYLVTMRDTA